MNDTLEIAIGHGVRSKIWKNESWSWESLKNKFLTPHVTSETFKQFITASKEDQLKIKDVGGFVGGYLRGGRRKPNNVIHRQLITLDIDEAPMDFWDSFQLMFDVTAILHGTHKHSQNAPRFRLIIPLSRKITSDEYGAISRYVAGILGIDFFDPTTFQPERLMFWPSISKDKEYYVKHQEGNWLNPDEVLNTYIDWKDTSLWPTSSLVLKNIENKTNTQENPEDKKGLVGAFCRTYSIHEVIGDYLSEEYVQVDDTRYTYTKGTASGGLVTYENKFAYSHHGTDPISGLLCNAFDLVRIHKFGHLDMSNHNKKPKSFELMQDLCMKDAKVKKTIALEKIVESRYDFDLTIKSENKQDEIKDDLEWAKNLEVDSRGNYLSNANNISLIFKNDAFLKQAFKENTFDDKKYVCKNLPWREIKTPEPIKNVDYSGVRNYIESTYGISGLTKIEDALNIEFQKHSFNPVLDYLKSLEWDGIKRIDTLLIEYFGSDNNTYTKEAIRKWLVGAVARIFVPGIKFDLVLTIVGDQNNKNQGTGKSTFISKLGKQWFSDSFHTVSGKEAFEQLQGAWLIEMAELSGTKKSEVETIKHFITKREDTYRPAYGRIVETFKRKCVFAATTNERYFLRDSSGNRRFMPIDVHEDRIKKNILDPNELDNREVDQIWAEAVILFENKETLYLSDEAEKIAKNEQKNHSQIDNREGIILNFLEQKLPDNWPNMNLNERRFFLNEPIDIKEGYFRMHVCIAEIWCECLGKEKHDMNRYNTREINDILRELEGWDHMNSTKNFNIYGKQKYYTRRLL